MKCSSEKARAGMEVIGIKLQKAVLIMIICVTIAMVIIGLYTGYRLGFEQKSKAYIGGGALLIAAGIDVIVRYIVMR